MSSPPLLVTEGQMTIAAMTTLLWSYFWPSIQWSPAGLARGPAGLTSTTAVRRGIHFGGANNANALITQRIQ